MTVIAMLFAQNDTVSLEDTLDRLGSDYRTLTLLGALLLVTLAAFVWAAFFRTHHRHRHHHHHFHFRRKSPSPPQAATGKERTFSRLFSREKHHRRRRRKRPRNPTLAEADRRARTRDREGDPATP
jgi:hypothetical protein